MKMFRKAAALITALSLVFVLCACGGSQEAPKEEPAKEAAQEAAEEKEETTEAEEEEETAEEAEEASEETTEEPAEEPEETDPLKKYAGTYSFVCGCFSAAYMDEVFDHYAEPLDIDDQYISVPQKEGEYVQLDPDGKGYLFWGEENQGPIDDWSMDGEKLLFHAGISEVPGTIKDGIMTLDIEEGCSFLFAAPDADTSAIKTVTSKEYLDLLYGPGVASANENTDAAAAEATDAATAESAKPAGGVYTMFAMQNEGYLVESKDADMSSVITLNEDGTGTMTMDDDSAGITSWVVNGDTITITVDDGSSASGKFLGDVIELDILGGGNMIIYYATADADISGYDLMTMEELQEAYKNKGN